MAQTTLSVATPGKHSPAPPTANKFAGTPKQGGAAVPPPPRQVVGTGTQLAWKSRLPVPTKKAPGGGTAKGTAVKGATTTGLPNLPTPPRISGGNSKLPIPTRKTPGGATRLPAPSLKTPAKDATGPPKKPAGTTKAPPAPRQVPRKGVASPAGNKVSQSGNKLSQSGNRVSELKTKAKSPIPTNVSKTANDTARKCIPPKPKASPVSLRKPSLSPSKVRGTAGAAAAVQSQNRQPPPSRVPATVITPVITSVAPVVVPMPPVVPPRVFVPLPSTYPGVKVCEGESLNPLPTDLQKATGAIYLERRRHMFAPKPGRPWLEAKLIVAPGEYCNKKPPPGPSPLKQCLSEEEVITRRIIIRVKGKVVAPHLGPKGRPRIFKDPNKCPPVVSLHCHRKWLMDKVKGAWWSPWWGNLRELQRDG